jgi:hypothetical protein
VIFRFHRLISSALVAIVVAAGVPYLACTPATCAATPECASMHCSCCGPNCPWHKNGSHESHKGETGCNQECPVVTEGKAMIASNILPISGLMLGAVEVRPFLVGYFGYGPGPVHDCASLDPPTLLRLGCAFTI